MPLKNYSQFDRSTLAALQKAYDRALKQLSISSKNPRSGQLAATLAALADEGERDPAVLCERALQRIGKRPASKKEAAAAHASPKSRPRR